MQRNFLNKLGGCPRCFRGSFFGAITGCAAVPIAFAAVPDPERWIVLAWPIAFSFLWILHMVMFARRVTSRSAERNSAASARLDRRRAILAFGGALGVGVFASIPALAQVVPCDQCQQYTGKAHDDCCLCKYNNCTSACNSGDNPCINSCLKTYNSC